jgi:hypothetical protein
VVRCGLAAAGQRAHTREAGESVLRFLARGGLRQRKHAVCGRNLLPELAHILGKQRFKKRHGAPAVAEHVRKLARYPAAVRLDAEKKLVFPQRGAGGERILLYRNAVVRLLQIVPKYTPPQAGKKIREARPHAFKRAPKRRRIHIRSQLRGIAEHGRKAPVCDNGVDIRGIVQRVPGTLLQGFSLPLKNRYAKKQRRLIKFKKITELSWNLFAGETLAGGPLHGIKLKNKANIRGIINIQKNNFIHPLYAQA